MGWHSPGEMSGLWLHPVKLADGFWLEVEDADTGESSGWSNAPVNERPLGYAHVYWSPARPLHQEDRGFARTTSMAQSSATCSRSGWENANPNFESSCASQSKLT